MRSELSLNLAHAYFTLNPFNAPLQEFPAANRTIMPESQASGGDRFQHWRKFRAAAYIKDALPTELGYASIKRSIINCLNIYGKFKHLDYVTSCNNESVLYSYDRADIINIAYLPSGSVIWFRDGTVQHGINKLSVDILGINAYSNFIVDVIGAHNRLIICTTNMLYWSGAENPFDFTPSLSNGAGSGGIVQNIGSIIKLVPTSQGFYVLGSNGGVYARCTYNIQYPFELIPVVNFNGILNYDSVHSDYLADKLLVYTKSGLQWLNEANAVNDFPDISYQLKLNTYIEFEFKTTYSDKSDLYEYLDNGCDSINYRPLFTELISEHNVMVNNISPRYTVVSYAYIDGAYTRLYVIDKFLDRSSSVHFKHTDVIHNNLNDRIGFIIADGLNVLNIYLGDGTSLLYLHEFSRLDGTVDIITKFKLIGDFYAEKYKDQYDNCHGDLLDVIAVQGVERLTSQFNNTMNLAVSNKREIWYSGKFRQAILSAIVPFSGWLTELTLS